MKPQLRSQYAELVSTMLGPVPMGVVLGIAVGINSGRGLLAGVGWGLLSVVCAAVLPAVSTVPLRKREARTPRLRLAYMAPAVAGALVGLVILSRLHAPRDVLVLATGFAAGLLCSAAVNAVYASSNHVAALAGGTVLAGVLLSPWAVTFAVAVAIGAWSRVAIGAHTVQQTLVGALVGAVAAALGVWVAT